MRRGVLIVCGLALGMAVVNGLARFACALVLPAMKAGLGWSYTESGSLNTTNAVGYLLGSYIASAPCAAGPEASIHRWPLDDRSCRHCHQHDA